MQAGENLGWVFVILCGVFLICFSIGIWKEKYKINLISIYTYENIHCREFLDGSCSCRSIFKSEIVGAWIPDLWRSSQLPRASAPLMSHLLRCTLSWVLPAMRCGRYGSTRFVNRFFPVSWCDVWCFGPIFQQILCWKMFWSNIRAVLASPYSVEF